MLLGSSVRGHREAQRGRLKGVCWTVLSMSSNSGSGGRNNWKGGGETSAVDFTSQVPDWEGSVGNRGQGAPGSEEASVFGRGKDQSMLLG